MILKNIYDSAAGIEEKHRLLISKAETETIALGYVSVNKGESTAEGFHNDEEEIYLVLKGSGILFLGDEKQEISEGDIAYVPKNTKHKMTCTSDEKLEYLYFANWPRKL